MFRKRITVLILTFCIISIATAGNFQWLNDSAAQAFTEKDWEIFSAALSEALSHSEDGGIQHWSNEVSGNSGTIEVNNRRQTAYGKCRSVITSSRTERQQGISRLNMCLQPDGSWKVDNRVK